MRHGGISDEGHDLDLNNICTNAKNKHRQGTSSLNLDIKTVRINENWVKRSAISEKSSI